MLKMENPKTITQQEKLYSAEYGNTQTPLEANTTK